MCVCTVLTMCEIINLISGGFPNHIIRSKNVSRLWALVIELILSFQTITVNLLKINKQSAINLGYTFEILFKSREILIKWLQMLLFNDKEPKLFSQMHNISTISIHQKQSHNIQKPILKDLQLSAPWNICEFSFSRLEHLANSSLAKTYVQNNQKHVYYSCLDE